MNAAHPLFHNILTAHFAIPGQTVHQARLGRRRTYLSESDTQAYDAGWCAFPAPLEHELAGTPYATGWYDRECAWQESQDAAADRLREIAECDGVR